MALLLRRYTASTLLALLQEICSSGDSKLNWTSLVKNTNSGISNAREYQTLWRHLAYRSNIPDGFEDDMDPLEDDSDLDFEVEPLPGVSPEVATNVAACVKVLATTGTSANSSSKNQEACFVIDIPNSSSGWEVKGNGQISNVVIQGAHTSETQPVRKKRKLWTLEEDQELIAAVEKCGEGNWATMLKGAFKHERTAAQLSQRWALIRKRRDTQTGISQNNVIDNQVHATGTNAVGSQLLVETASLLLTADGQRVSAPALATAGPTSGVGNMCSMPAAVSNNAPLTVSQEQICSQNVSTPSTTLPQSAGKGRPPMKRTGVSGSQQGRLISPSAALVGSSAGQATSGGGEFRQAKSLPATSVSLPIGSSVSGRYNVSSGMRNSSVSSVGRIASKSSAGPDPMVQAAAVAAGARIAPASAAASLFKAAQSGNVVHIGPGGVSMGKAGVQSQTGSNAATSSIKVGSGSGSRSSGGTLVHYIRTGTGSPQSLLLTGQRASQLKGQVTRASSPQVTHTVRPGAATLPPPGLSATSVLSQKPHPPAFTSAPALKTKSTSPPALPGDSRAAAMNDAAVKPADCLESDGVVKTAAQDLTFAGNLSTALHNHPTDSVSGCIPDRQIAGLVSHSIGPVTNTVGCRPELPDISGKASFSAVPEMGIVTTPMVPSCSIEVERDLPGSPALTTTDEKIEGTTKDSPEVNVPECLKSGEKTIQLHEKKICMD